MEIYHQYIRLRKQFGRHPKFTDEGAEMLADIRPDEDSARSYVARNPMSTASQCVPEMSEHEANTTAVMYANKCMSHLEGGWPKDVDYTEAEHTIRYRKKVEKDEDYIRTVASLGGKLEELVKQNNSIDIYQQYFQGIALDHSAEVPCASTITVFKDPSAVRRNASYMHWHPDSSAGKVVVAYGIMAFQKQPAGMPTSSYIWDVNSPNTPELTLTPASQLCCAKFNNKDPNIIGAGQYNGQVRARAVGQQGRIVMAGSWQPAGGGPGERRRHHPGGPAAACTL
jgi:dynein intermediate chain 2